MSKSYHTLLVKYDCGWSIEFGDYDYKDVVSEMRFMCEDGNECKIITTGDQQADVEHAVAKLNGIEFYEPGDHLKLWINQGERSAWVLGTLNELMIVEYEMPAGTTALKILKNEKGYNQRFGWKDDEYIREKRKGFKYFPKSVSYKSCPDKWIQAIREGCGCWEGICQRNGLVPFPDEPMIDLHYFCSDCKLSWDDEWSSYVDNDCEECGATYTPFDSLEDRDRAEQQESK